MDECPEDIYRMFVRYLCVSECLRFECAVQLKLHDKPHYVKLFEREPMENTFRFFKKGKFRTYKVYTYIKDGITWSDVSISPICKTFTCKHKFNVTPSVANKWMLMCISADADKNAFASMKASLVTI